MFLCGFDDLKMPARAPRGCSLQSLWAQLALGAAPLGGHGGDQCRHTCQAPEEPSEGVGWAGLGIPAPGKAGSRSLAGSGHGASATLGVGAAVGAVPAVIPEWLQQLSWLPATVPTAP